MTGTLRVLTYHRVLDPRAGSCNPSVVSANPADFARQMEHVARRYHAVSAEEVLHARRCRRSLPDRAVLVTFDDGCRDFGEVAWPIMRRLGVPATVFVPTAYPGQPDRAFWWDRLFRAVQGTMRRQLALGSGPALPLDTRSARQQSLRTLQARVKTLPHGEAMCLVDDVCRELGEHRPPTSTVLDWDELRSLAADGVAIGAHTRTHPALTRMTTDEARAEIRGGWDDLVREIRRPVRVFAYPFGDHDARVASLVQEAGFELAVTCVDGHNRFPHQDPMRVRRTNVTPRTTPLVFRLRLTPLGVQLDRWRHGADGGAPRAAASPAPGSGVRPASALKVAYIMSRFPKLSETFVLNELRVLAERRVPVEVYPLLRERQPVVHPEVAVWTDRAHFLPFLSPAILRAHARAWRRQPHTYVRVVGEIVRGTWGSPRMLGAALAVFPKVVWFAQHAREQGVTHVHAHFATHPALAALVVHRLTGIPFSFTAHGSDLHVDRRMLDVKVRAAAFAVTVSEFNRAIMVRECGADAAARIHVVHCGVDPDVFKPPPRRDANDVLSIACVASLEPVKGHRFLVEACRVLEERGRRVRCHLVGDGPCRRDLERQIAGAGLQDSVVLLGGRPRDEVSSLLAHADVAVLASHPTPEGKREGIPVALMEAMAAGLPVVASAISGIPELVEDGRSGLLVPSGDPVALADALDRLAGDDELRRRLGAAARGQVQKAFDLRTNVDHLVQLFVAVHSPERAVRSAVVRAAVAV